MADRSLRELGAGVAELPEVWEPEAATIQRIFAQVPASAGVPGVHLVWRLLANFPDVLEAAWPPLDAAFGSDALEGGARRLRRQAFIEEAVGLPSHKAFRGDLVRAEIDADFREKISNFNDLSQYGLSRLLIVLAALDAPESRERAGAAMSVRVTGTPAGAIYVPPLRAGEARGTAIEILERVRREHGLALLDDYCRSLARIPDYLAAAWNAICPLVNDTEYLARAAELSGEAARIAAELRIPLALGPATARLTQRHAVQLRGVIAYFARLLLPQTLIDVTLVKALTEGPQRATHVPFDAARESDALSSKRDEADG